MKELNESEKRMTRRTARISRFPLDSPRELRFSGGKVTWKPPQNAETITHYRVYADNEYNLVREVPVGQNELHDNLTAQRIFISSYSRPLDQESVKEPLLRSVHPVIPDSVEAYGANPDGVIVFDGAMTGNVFTSAGSDLTGREGQLLWVEGAGEGGLDLLTSIKSVTSRTTCIALDAAATPVTGAEARFGPDSTQALTAAHNQALVDGAAYLVYRHGIYLTTASLPLISYLTIRGDGWSYDGYTAGPQTIVACCADVPVMQFVEEEGAWASGNISAITFRGTKRTGSKGIYSVNSLGAFIELCAFDHFGDQAIHLENGVFGIHIKGCSATGSCLVRERADYVGVFDIRPGDLFMDDCEVSCSTSDSEGGQFGDGKIAAFAIRGNNSWVHTCMAHHSQIGFYVGSASSPQLITTFVNVRADRNQGHGYVIDAFNCNFIGCRSHANGMDADGAYDGFHVASGGHQFHGCQVTTLSDAGTVGDGIVSHNRLRDGFHFAVPGFTHPSLCNYNMIGNAFSLSRENVVTRDLYHVESGSRAPIVLDYELHAPTDTYQVRYNNAVNMDQWPLYFRATAGAANTRIWSLGPDVSGAPNVFNISAWNDARNAFVFPFAIYRNQTTGAIDYIRLSQAEHLLINNIGEMTIDANIFIGNGRVMSFGSVLAEINAGSGSPEGVVAAAGGSLFLDGSGALWVKVSGTGDTGWRSVSGLIDLVTGVTGVLPLAHGGTNGNSSTAARTSLDVYSKSEVDALIAGIDLSDYVTKTDHNAHDHQYDPTGTNPLSHTGSANPPL